MPAQSNPSKTTSSGPVLAKILEELSVPRQFVDQVGASVVLPSVEELADILHLPHIHHESNPAAKAPTPAGASRSDATSAEPQQGDPLDGLTFSTGSPPPSAGDAGGGGGDGSSTDAAATKVIPGNPEPSCGGGSGDGGEGRGSSGGNGNGNGGGDSANSNDDGGEERPQPAESAFRSQLWMAVAISLALVIPPSSLMALLLHLSRPLLQPLQERHPRPRLARVTPRKRRFVLLQHAATQALDGSESFLLLSPRSVAATLLFPAASDEAAVAPAEADDDLQRAIMHVAAVVPGIAQLPSLPLNAQLTGLAEALTAAYERETRLAARLITRRAVSYALSNEKICELTATLGESSRALALSKQRLEAISCSMEALHQDLDRDVSLLCAQLQGVSEHRDALLAELATRCSEMAEATAARENVEARLQEAEAENQEVQERVLELHARLDESDACARLAIQERDQERRRTNELTSQLKNAARFAAALEGAMSALPDLQTFADDTEIFSDVGASDTAPDVELVHGPSPLPVLNDDGSSSSGVALTSPLRAVVLSAQQRASELLQLQKESAALQQQVHDQAAAHAVHALALACAQQEAAALCGDVARLEEQLAQAMDTRRGLEADLAAAQAMLGVLHDRLRASAEDLAAARQAQSDAELQLQAERASLGAQLHLSQQELAASRAHLQHAQHHVAEALAEKATLRQHLAMAQRQLQAAEAEGTLHSDRCRAAEEASSGLAKQLADVQAELTALAAKLQRAQADAGSALAAKAGLEAYVAELTRVQEQAAACAASASEELRTELAELQARLDDAQAGRRIAEEEASGLRDRVAELEAQLAAAEAAAVSAADAEAQRVAELRGELDAATAALQDAQTAVAAARSAEKSQTAAVQVAMATIVGLQATIAHLQQSLSSAEQELQQHHAEAAAAAAASAAHAAKLLHDLQQRDALAADLHASLAEVQVQLGQARADADSKAKLQADLAEMLRELQLQLGMAEAVDVEAAGRRDAHASDLAQRCEAACRAAAHLNQRLDASEASRRELLAQMAVAEAEQRRLQAEVAAAEADRCRLQEQLHAAGETRGLLEAQVAAGESSLSELKARLHRAEEVLSEALSQLSDANSAVRLLHQRAAVGPAPSEVDQRQEPAPTAHAATDMTAATEEEEEETARREADNMCKQLVARLQQLQSNMDLAEAASADERSRHASQLVELQQRCEDDRRSAAVLQGQLTAGEVARQELQARLTASEVARQELQARTEEALAERQRLTAEVEAAQVELAELREALDSAADQRQRLEEELVASKASRADLAERLHAAEAARADVVAQLSFSSSALQLLQQHLESADSERLDLQAQLGALLEDRRELQDQLGSKMQELQSCVDAAEAASGEASQVLAARVAELVQRCEVGDAVVQRLQAQLAASEAARRELSERATEVAVARQALTQQVAAAEAAQKAIVLQAAEAAEAAQHALGVALDCTDAERRELQARLADGQVVQEELRQRLEGSEAERVAVADQLAASNGTLAVLHVRLEEADHERQALQAGLDASLEERRGLQRQLSELLLQAQGGMDAVEASAVQADALRAAEAEELRQRCNDAACYVLQLQAQLWEGESARQQLLQRLAEVGSEHQALLVRLTTAETERQQLRERASAAEAAVQELPDQLRAADEAQAKLHAQLKAGEVERGELRARLDSVEAARAEAQAQLSDASLALRMLQQNLDGADAERMALQAQLDAVAADARGVQSHLAARMLELQAAMALVEAAAGRTDALQAAQRSILELQRDEGCRATLELQGDLAASRAAQQELQERVARAQARQDAMQEELDAAGRTRQAMEARAADEEAVRAELQARLAGTEAARAETLARLADATASLAALQHRLDASDHERAELRDRWAASAAACQELQVQLTAANAARECDAQRLEDAEAAREGLAGQAAAAEAAVLELRVALEDAETEHAAQVEGLRSEAAAGRNAAAAQLAEAGEVRRVLQEQLADAEAAQDELQARLAAADAARAEQRSQLAASAAALHALQEQLEGWEAACATTQQQLARTDDIARELMTQLEESEARRLELQDRLAATEAAFAELQAQLADSQRERDGLSVRLAEAEKARSGLQMQVHRFRTQLATATDSAVIRRMTNATAIQEQYERLSEEVARERQATRARQEGMMAEITVLQEAADQSTVRATVRIALARACLRAVEEERRRLHEEMQLQMQQQAVACRAVDARGPADEHYLHFISPTRRTTSQTGPSDGGFMVATAAAAAADVRGHRRRSSDRVASLGGFLHHADQETGVDGATAGATTAPDVTTPTAAASTGLSQATDYHQQLEDVRQRLIELRPQTARSLAAVDAALEVPSSFVDMVQSAVASASPLVARQQAARASRLEQRSRDLLRDSFSMFPDLGSLGSMLETNNAAGSAGTSAGGAAPGGAGPRAGSAPRQETVQQGRLPPAVPFSTPVTDYRQSTFSRGCGSRYATPPVAADVMFSPATVALPPSSLPIEEQLAMLQDELNKVEETGRLLGARLDAACQSPSASILETVTAQFQHAHSHQKDQQPQKDTFFRRSAGRSPLAHDALCPDPLMQLESDVDPTPRDANAVAAALAALRDGIQSVIAAQQQHQQQRQHQAFAPASPSQHSLIGLPTVAAAASMSVLLAHVQVLEDYLLGTSSLLPTPTGMLLQLPRSPAAGQARYAAPAAKPGVGGAAGGVRIGGGRAGGGGVGAYTDGGSTPHELPSPKTEASSEPITTPSDSPLLMATDSPAPPVTGFKHSIHHHHHHPFHNQNQHLELQQGSDQYHRHPHQQYDQPFQTFKPRKDLIAADSIIFAPRAPPDLSASAAASAAHAAAAAVTSAAAAAASVAVAAAAVKVSPELPPGSVGAPSRRVAAIHALAYEDSSTSVYAPSLTSLTRAQGLMPAWERDTGGGGKLTGPAGASGAAAAAGAGAGSRAMMREMPGASGGGAWGQAHGVYPEGRRSDEDPYYGQQEWRSTESPSPHSVDEANVLTATPLQCSPAQPGLAEPAPPAPAVLSLSQQQQRVRQLQSASLNGAVAATPAPVPAVSPVLQNHRSAAGGTGGNRFGGGTAAAASQASSPCTPNSDDEVCVATPLAFAVVAGAVAGGAAAATPCLTPAPLDAFAAEQLLRYTNPCFARTPSANELGAGDQQAAAAGTTHQQLQLPQQDGDAFGGCRPHGRRGYERPPFAAGQGVPPMPTLGECLPALEMSESVDISVLRSARRRAAGLSATMAPASIEGAPVASLLQANTRGGGHSMPVLATPTQALKQSASSSSEDLHTSARGAHAASAMSRSHQSHRSSGGAPAPPQFPAAGHAESISLYGSVVEPAAYDSYKVDPQATGLLCMPTRRPRFSFRLPSRQGSRRVIQACHMRQGGMEARQRVVSGASSRRGSESNASNAAEDTASIGSSAYQLPQYVQYGLGSQQTQGPPSIIDTATQSESGDLSAAGALPPRPPMVGGKRKKGGILGKIKRAVDSAIGRSSSTSASGAGALASGSGGGSSRQPWRSSSVNGSMNMMTPRPSF
ncbi:hypothetical protein PLESTB_001316600 [Pleodorina starrii]|uniref:Uncharacterized protein n=1 Tax=Pleodorina starrii TaxID=330485 RepID=A0A9W6BU23_9CHLO|nr:hypothetical protein PLESTB_001316600 [Pleodorina starrii]